MAKIFQVLKRTTQQIVGGSVNSLSKIRAGISARNKVEGTIQAKQVAGVAARQTPTTLVTREVVGVSVKPSASGQSLARQQAGVRAVVAPTILTLRSVIAGAAAKLAPVSMTTRQVAGLRFANRATGTIKPTAKAGVSARNRMTATPAKPVHESGLQVARVSFDLTRRVGGNAVAETAVGGRTDWASDANVISGTNGLHDGSVATFAGNALGARGGQLELSYADSVNKTELVISSVKLHFYGRVFNTSLNNADVQLRWSKGGAFTTLETIAGDSDFRTTPKTHDITASIAGWADIDALKTAFRADAAALETWQAEADACEVEIVAQKIDWGF